MSDALTTMQTRMLALVNCADLRNAPLPEPLDVLVASARPQRITCEVLVFADRRAKLWYELRVDAAPVLDRAALTQAGWRVDVRPNATELRKGRTAVLILEESEGIVIEWSEPIAEIAEDRAHAEIAAIPLLACFAAIARPPAHVDNWGVAARRGEATLGLVKLRRDLERVDKDEATLRALGFAPEHVVPDDADDDDDDDNDDALWSTPGGGHTVVWAGGTLYGYAGRVPRESIGGWA